MRMHYRFFVTTAPAASSLEARRRVTDGLYEQGFIEQDYIDPDARWRGGVADWFVIGGRWTGLLAGIGDAEWQCRNHYRPLGEEDDAMLITPELFDRFLAPYKGKVPRRNGSEYVDLEYERLNRGFIGRKWLVVVDYHC